MKRAVLREKQSWESIHSKNKEIGLLMKANYEVEVERDNLKLKEAKLSDEITRYKASYE